MGNDHIDALRKVLGVKAKQHSESAVPETDSPDSAALPAQRPSTMPPPPPIQPPSQLRNKPTVPAPAPSPKSVPLPRPVRNREPASSQPAKVIRFPAPWNDGQRGVPTICLRSALFGVVGRGKRRYLQNQQLMAQAGYEVRYTGMRLDQSDLDVWQQVIHHCRGHAVEERVFFSRKSFLRDIGRNDGKSDREWLKQSLDRMVACAVILEHGNRRYASNLLGWGVDDQSGHVFVRVNREIAQFFLHQQFTLVDAKRRFALKSQIAKWIHDYYSSLPETPVLSVAELRDFCGSEIANLFKFRQKLKAALDELKGVGFLRAWHIDEADSLFLIRSDEGEGDSPLTLVVGPESNSN